MKRYDELKRKEKSFQSYNSFLEKAVELDPKKCRCYKTHYSALEMTAETNIAK
jgi:hypothetical protein